MKRISIVLVCLLAAGMVTARDVRYAFLGDSNTWNGGVDCSRQESWCYWFMQQMQPATCYNLARSGATWTNTAQTLRAPHDSTAVLSEQNVVFNQVVRLLQRVQLHLQDAPDVILIMAGTNDAWFEQKRPGIWDMTVEEAFAVDSKVLLRKEPGEITSLALSVRYSVETLQRAFPLADIVLLTPMPTTKASAEKIARVGEILDGCGLAAGVPVIHLENEQIETKDGTHTNPAGAKKLGLKIASIITRYGIR
jgi:lysophospholipase L1-like esterase